MIKKMLSFVLVCSMAFNSTAIAFANMNSGDSLKVSFLESETAQELNENISELEYCQVTDDGITINGTFYTQTQFVDLLSTAIKAEDENSNDIPQTRAAIIAGSWVIPGLGTVIITTAGIIYLGGKIIEAGTWAYDAVIEFFEEKEVADDYENAKDDGSKTDNHSTKAGRDLPTSGEDSYSSKDLKDDAGTLKQRRYYDKNGDADMDIDYHHGGNGSEPFPHRHDWNNGSRGKAYW